MRETCCDRALANQTIVFSVRLSESGRVSENINIVRNIANIPSGVLFSRQGLHISSRF
ncbi:hypothetical protein D1AOALGA4SA_11398 [Olavius algarvensis Delta 1 endosymbiont]|nr:hypothetical protein D1AOALGA4SA_11398 [Olavius algarvensis Delta 1 endosymbiont]